MGRVAALLLLAATVSAEPDLTEVEILDRWRSASPEERRRMRVTLERLEKARRFSEARPILIEVDKRTYTLAELFEQVLEPPLATPLQPANPQDLGLTAVHRRALVGLIQLRRAYEPPHPVRTGTLNLMLGYAHRALIAPDLSPAGRLRFFSEALRNVQALDGRVKPDGLTRWIIHNRLLPALLGMARSAARLKTVRDALADAASLLYLPSILDARAQRLLAPLTRNKESRRILLRAYRHGLLDRLGLVALARSVVARTKGDAAFATGALPLVLELLNDAALPARERAELLDATLGQLSPLGPFRPSLADLCAAAYGGPPRTLEQYRERRAEEKGLLVAPRGKRSYRFLNVVMVQASEERPPVISRVVRVDAPWYQPLHVRDRGGGRRFVGVLVPAAGGEHADFLGPPPGISGARDNRLLRRTLRLERLAISVFGAKSEVIELCVALPEDRSEPVPRSGAALGHVLDLLEARLARSAEADELADLVRLLVRIDTAAARALAVRYARKPGVLTALLPLAERRHEPAARALLDGIAGLGHVERERALAAALRSGLSKPVRALCRNADVSIAALAGDALMDAGDPEGVRSLLQHPNRYARATGTALALRLTPLAGRLRVTPEDAAAVPQIAGLCLKAFDKPDDDAWRRYGAWLGDALIKPEEVRAARGRLLPIRVGKQKLSPAGFHTYCLATFSGQEHKKYWANFPAYVLSPVKPGRGMTQKALKEVLDAIEERLDHAPLRDAWRDALIVLACVQHGIEVDVEFGKLAHARLTRLAGGKAPPGARRKPGVYWPIWAARDARE